jgi:multidrug efflux pump
MIVLILLMAQRIPSAFLPPEDQGYLLGAIIMPDAASLDRTGEVGKVASDFFMNDEAVEGVAIVNGYSLLDGQNKNNAAAFFVGFKDFEGRYKDSDTIAQQSAPAVLQKAAHVFSTVQEGIILPVNPPSIPGLGTTGGMEVWIQSKGDASLDQLSEVVGALMTKAKERPELGPITSTFNVHSRQLMVDVNREKAESLGVPVEDVYSAMQTMFGSLYVSQFNKFSRLWQVILQAEPSYRLKAEDLQEIYVRNRNGEMVPLKAVLTTRYVTGPDLLTRFNNFPAVKLTANAAPGYSSGQALKALEEISAEIMTNDYSLALSGEAFEEKKSGGASSQVFIFGMVMVFLILAAQYEKWSLPIGVLLAVPFALFGALLAVLIRGLSNDVYFQIGLTMLVALAAKNAILIFEFAVLNRENGMSAYDAAMTAAKERLRPIVMTSLAFILGCVPLAIAVGASENSRHSIGTGVIGGMLAATVVAIFFIPLFYYLAERMFGKKDSAQTAAQPALSAPPAQVSGSSASHGQERD